MRQLVVFLTILFASNLYLLAQTPTTATQTQIPIIELPLAPTNIITDPDDDLYSNLDVINILFEYYNASMAYQTQLKLLGMPVPVRIVRPNTAIITQDPEQEIIETMLLAQWNQVNTLYNEVRKVPANVTNKKMEDRLKQLHALQEEKLDQDMKILALQLDSIRNAQYKDLYGQALAELSNNNSELNTNIVPSIGLSLGASVLSPDIDNINIGGSPYLGLYLNPTGMLGMPNVIDFWVDFSLPHYEITNDNKHYGNIITTGINARLLPMSRLLNIKNFNWDIKGGFGWFWYTDEMPNNYVDKNSWNGYLLKIETNIDNLATRFPFGIFASYSWMHINNRNDNIYIWNYISPMNSDWMKNFNIGIRFYLAGNNRKACSLKLQYD